MAKVVPIRPGIKIKKRKPRKARLPKFSESDFMFAAIICSPFYFPWGIIAGIIIWNIRPRTKETDDAPITD